MEKKSIKKIKAESKEIKLQKTVDELSKINQKRKEELFELDRIAKMLIRRDFELNEIKKKREEELRQLEEKTKDLEKSGKALINMLEDVDQERRNAEEEKDKTLAIITNFSDGILFFDEKRNLLLANPQAEKFLDFDVHETIGKSASELNELSIFKELISLIGVEIKEVFRKEFTIKKTLVIEVSTDSIISSGKEIGVLVILHNITREKMVERIKTEFVSVAAHQLRTPLSAIKWTLKMFLDGDIGSITTEQEEFLKKIYISNERMISLINDLLDVTRIEEGRYLYKPALADIKNIVELLIDSYKDYLSRKKIEFVFECPEEKIPNVMIDVEKMRLAIQNLFDNAIKYTSLGGKITVSLKHDKNNKKIAFSIKDTGVGIPNDQQSRVFSKFFRGANVIKMETDGSGLGVFISKNVIESHDGKIWFKSEEGKGTTFYFSIPVA